MQDFYLLQDEINRTFSVNQRKYDPKQNKYASYELEYINTSIIDLEEDEEDNYFKSDIQTFNDIIDDNKKNQECKYLDEADFYFIPNKEPNDYSFLNKKTQRINIPNSEKDEKIQKSIKKESKENMDESPFIKTKNDSSDTEKIYRNDYYIKKFKVECFSKYVTKNIKEKIKACLFPSGTKISKIYKPNNKCFTSETNIKKNNEFLKMKLYEVFSIYDEENGKNQEKNEAIFNRIYKCTKAKNIQAHENLKNYLKKTVEEIIKEYYDSKEFIKFSSDKEIIEKDKAFFKEKKFSLLKDYGFIKLIQNKY